MGCGFSCCSGHVAPSLEFKKERRPCQIPELVGHLFKTKDEKQLRFVRAQGGNKGPIILAPGTAMSSLSFCSTLVPQSFGEYLFAQGYDVWMLDWRTSPDLQIHTEQATLDEVAQYDWPAAVDFVREQTKCDKVLIFAHCLSSTCLSMSLLRGHLDPSHVAGIIASQVFMHPKLTFLQNLKAVFRLDYLIPKGMVIHFKKADRRCNWGEAIFTVMTPLIHQVSRCNNFTCRRMNAAMGGILYHPQIDAELHDGIGELIPAVVWSFVHDSCKSVRRGNVGIESTEMLKRLNIPISLFSGEHNSMFVTEGIERSFQVLVEVNGPEKYHKTVIKGYGHLDCLMGKNSATEVFPLFLGEMEWIEKLNAQSN